MEKKRINLSKKIAEIIRQEIINKQLKPGDRLPGEYELSEQYGVSRFTIREAMNYLSSIGLVDIRHGVGMFVDSPTSENYIKPLVSILTLTDNDIVTICETRMPIETQAIALCAQRITSGEIEQLEAIYAEMEVYYEKDDLDGYNDADLNFHLAIALYSRNSIIYEILSALQDLLRAQIHDVLIVPNSRDNSIKKHLLMIEAIKQRDSDLASLLMSRHINDSIIYYNSKQNLKMGSTNGLVYRNAGWSTASSVYEADA